MAKTLVEINKGVIMARIHGKASAGMYKLAAMIRADCNRFVRVDKGTMRASSYTASELTKGRIVWQTPYVRRVYFTGTPSRDINPQASLLWCEKAKKYYLSDWVEAAAQMLDAGVKGK